MRSKGVPVSLFGCGGWAVFARRCPTFATVRKCPREVAMAVPLGKFCKRGHFWSFPALHSFISRGGHGTLWHFNIFDDVSRVVLCGRRNTFATFSDDGLHFSWQAQHFGDLRCYFAWQAQHFRRGVLPVFCESYCQRCAKWWRGANSVPSVAFCDMMKIDGRLARNVDFEVGP